MTCVVNGPQYIVLAIRVKHRLSVLAVDYIRETDRQLITIAVVHRNNAGVAPNGQ